jgi:ribosomal protein L31E
VVEEEKLFKSPEEKKREEKLVEEKEKPRAEEKSEAKEAQAEEKEKAKKAVETVAKKEEKAKEEKKKAKEEKKAKEKEKKREIVLQRVFVVPLGKAYSKPRSARARVATRLLKAFIAKHFKVAPSKVRLAPQLNSLVRSQGDRKPLKSVRVNASKDKDGGALAEPAK